MKWILLGLNILICQLSLAQFKTYTGFHYGFSKFKSAEINRFVVQFNDRWSNELLTGFSQYEGNELGQTFTTSGLRIFFNQFTISTDYAYGFGSSKNLATFSNGISQEMILRARNNQISNTFGIILKDGTYWLEGMLVTNLARIIIEYSTLYPNDLQSFGTEYRLNGLYEGKIKTTEFGFQASYKYKKYVLYSRILLPLFVIGPSKDKRSFVDVRSSQPEPNDFPSDYNSFIDDPVGHQERGEFLNSKGFKGLSFGFGMFYYIGKS